MVLPPNEALQPELVELGHGVDIASTFVHIQYNLLRWSAKNNHLRMNHHIFSTWLMALQIPSCTFLIIWKRLQSSRHKVTKGRLNPFGKVHFDTQLVTWCLIFQSCLPPWVVKISYNWPLPIWLYYFESTNVFRYGKWKFWLCQVYGATYYMDLTIKWRM